jgi:26S proteasome regulatory subunit N2
MTKDSVDYVRQGALIALGMILVQHNETSCPEVLSSFNHLGSVNEKTL